MSPAHNDHDTSQRYYSRYSYRRRASPSAHSPPPPPYHSFLRSPSPDSSLTALVPPFHPTGTFKPRRKDPAPIPTPPLPYYHPGTPSSLFRHADELTDLSFSTSYPSLLQPRSRRRTRAQGQNATDSYAGIGSKGRSELYESWEEYLFSRRKAEEERVKLEKDERVAAAARTTLERKQEEEGLKNLGTKRHGARESEMEVYLRGFRTRAFEAEVRKRREEREARVRNEEEKRLREEVGKRLREEMREKKVREGAEKRWKREVRERQMREELERKDREEIQERAEREKIWEAGGRIDVREEGGRRTLKEMKRYGRYFYKGSNGELLEYVWKERR
ncbi:uncharacterized protein EI97DRAFT_45094 [Westerdykella ornata]|uniref:Uncharacterized protein n=1 Tax=Westerdykella ornata TaxID=318751 RepID=A0A6A6JIV6_WESOR|nr:uncharacterized protein EI97DRAFT_45094 [Westerdykella ornata]KAF2276590.1 hypothetical protein EI97DRAFT_45094 [Westerdykella ornata]